MRPSKDFLKKYALLIAAFILSLLSILHSHFSEQTEPSYNSQSPFEPKQNNQQHLKIQQAFWNEKDNTNPLPYTLDRVIDGDGIFLKQGGEKFSVRLYGVDSPEYKQAYGKEALIFLETLLAENPIEHLQIIYVRGDRLYGIPYLENGQSLQEILLANGITWYSDKYCQINNLCIKWQKLEKLAKKEKLGLWQNKNAISPWAWKRQNR